MPIFSIKFVIKLRCVRYVLWTVFSPCVSVRFQNKSHSFEGWLVRCSFLSHSFSPFAFQPYAHKTPTIIINTIYACVIILCKRVVWMLARFRVLKILITLRVCLFICCCYYYMYSYSYYFFSLVCCVLILEHVSLI